MNKEILFILLPDYAAHEAVYFSQAITADDFAMKKNPKYVNKVVAPTLEPISSIGGFQISVTLSSVIIAIIVCKLLIFNTLRLQQFFANHHFSGTYISSNSR